MHTVCTITGPTPSNRLTELRSNFFRPTILSNDFGRWPSIKLNGADSSFRLVRSATHCGRSPSISFEAK